jgi:hypothetical protein
MGMALGGLSVALFGRSIDRRRRIKPTVPWWMSYNPAYSAVPSEQIWPQAAANITQRNMTAYRRPTKRLSRSSSCSSSIRNDTPPSAYRTSPLCDRYQLLAACSVKYAHGPSRVDNAEASVMAIARPSFEDDVFRLLVPASEAASSDPTTSIDVAGERWQIVDHGAVPLPADAPAYICVSYSWGDGRTANPFDPTRPMSPRVRPALETAIATLRPAAVWLDAACMPSHEPARSRCLQSMGAIYAAASGVLAVLPPSIGSVLDAVGQKKAVSSEHLQCLKADDWVSRVWTYQEIANSKIMSFAIEGQRSAPLAGATLLNGIGQAITQCRQAEEVDAYEFRQRHARLDAWETLIADWIDANYAERSAYRVMTAMVGRNAQNPDDHFYAMIGAISTALSDPNRANQSPAEYFMRVCEEKGDFSFIYSSATRATGPVCSWRPIPGPLLPIIPWASDGERQTGEPHATSLRLHNMANLTLGQLDGAPRTFIQDWLQKTVRRPSSPDMAGAVGETLRRAGFGGCGEYFETTDGYFFPQNPLGRATDCRMLAASDITFRFGAPGLLLDPVDAGNARLRDVGVFVGQVPTNRQTIMID